MPGYVFGKDQFDSQEAAVKTDGCEEKGTDNRHRRLSFRRSSFPMLDGASVEPGATLEEASVVDVAATPMAHLGLEVDSSWDWDGSAAGLKS